MADAAKKTTRKKRQIESPAPQSAIDNRQSAIEGLQSPISPRRVADLNGDTNRPPQIVSLLPYQRRWIEDDSPLKIVVKARQIGYSFAATLRVVFECLKRKTTWILLSKGERQSKLMMEKVQEHIQSCGIVAQAFECEYFEGASFKQLETRFPNGSVIYGLPANPDTARGYSGNVTLDEFAFHADAEKIYSALYPSITRGYRLEVISTPNGQQGKFYELAKQAGLDGSGFGVRDSGFANAKPGSGIRGSGFAEKKTSPVPSRNPNPESQIQSWSGHYCDIYEAVRQGLKINLQQLRAGCEDDAAWRQEFGCQFVSTAENFFPPELVSRCLSVEASTEAGSGFGVRGSGFADNGKSLIPSRSPNTESRNPSSFFLGIDIGRRHDRTVFWIDEVMECGSRGAPGSAMGFPLSSRPGERIPLDESGSKLPHSKSITRLVRTLSNVPFDTQLAYARALLGLREGNGSALIRRAAIDATGMGAPLAESLAQEFGARVEPVVFTAAVKEDLAYRTKRRMENGLTLLPDSREVRRAFAAVKKFVTVSGNVRFDAERTDAGHSDEFWAKALADLAAETRPAAHLSDGYLADGKPLISASAFMQVDANWAAALNRMVF